LTRTEDGRIRFDAGALREGKMSNVLSDEKRLRVLMALVEGNSERAVERMTGVSREAVGRFALILGNGAMNLHNQLARDLSISLITVDEVWAFVQKKARRVTDADPAEFGDAYVFSAMASNSRFILSWHVGKRNEESARAFMADVRSRLCVMPAMTSDGFAPYVNAVEASFGRSIDYAMTVKNYSRKGRRDDDHRYEPPRDPFISKKAIFGAPDLASASTAYIERNNATMRHHIGRMRRLCYAFSKKLPNLQSAVALNYAWYNLVSIVKTLRVTPAMAAHVTKHVWEPAEFLDAVLSAKPCDGPAVMPLKHREPETTHRALPTGRGFLRVIDGGKGTKHVEQNARPVQIERAPTGTDAEVVQLDLFARKRRAPKMLASGQYVLPGFEEYV
jgi:hypothetical protein